MAMDLRKDYYQPVRKIAAGFDPESAQADMNEPDPRDRTHLKLSTKPVYLISVANPAKDSYAGQVVLTRPMLAAERIYDQTHVVANEEQIRTYEAKQEVERAANLAADQKSKETVNTTITLSPELASALSAAQQPQESRRRG